MRPRSDRSQQQCADRTDQRWSSRGGPARWLISLTLKPFKMSLYARQHTAWLFNAFFFTVRKSQQIPINILVYWNHQLGLGWAILTGFSFPKRTKKMWKWVNSLSFLWSISWPAFCFSIRLSSRLSHDSVSKAPLCSRALNVVTFPEGC